MFALIERRGKTESCRAAEKRVCGVRFFAVGIREGNGLRARLSIRAAARTLRSRGLTRAVFPDGFAEYGRFARCGVYPVETRPLREAAAAEIVRRAMAQRGLSPERTTVALCAAQVTRAYAAAAEALAREVRYVLLCTERGGWELSRKLCRTLGAAAPTEPSCAQAEGADILLRFDEWGDVSAARGLVLPLYNPAMRVEYADDRVGAAGAQTEQLLAALYAALALRAEDIRVRAVEPPG